MLLDVATKLMHWTTHWLRCPLTLYITKEPYPMTQFLRTLELLSAEEITGEQTGLIDLALSCANASEISDADAAKVIDYIGAQLLHNSVSDEIRCALDRLQKELLSRGA